MKGMHRPKSIEKNMTGGYSMKIRNERTKAAMGRDRGSVAVEASIAVPVFLFLLLFFYHLLHVSAVRQVVYESAVEAAEYTAEYYYLQSTLLDEPDGIVDQSLLLAVASHTMKDRIDDTELVERYVKGGVAGISLWKSVLPDKDGELVFHISYTICIDTPMLPTVSKKVEETIRQRPYTGQDPDTGEGIESDPYVYITDNKEVYHRARSCSHILLGIRVMSVEEARQKGYRACEYCGNSAGMIVLVGPEGECYHGNANCRGVKRTVHRVRLSEVGGIPPCSRCGK